MVEPSFLVADNQQDNADVVEDFLFGHDCVMSDGEWACFCRDVLLLEHLIAQTFDVVIEMVDDMIVALVHAVCGGERFTYGVGSEGPKVMDFVVALVQFLMLCGSSGVMPRDYALAQFGDVCPLVACSPFANCGGRSMAHKMVRRLTSLGRCVRGLIRAVWMALCGLIPSWLVCWGWMIVLAILVGCPLCGGVRWVWTLHLHVLCRILLVLRTKDRNGRMDM